MAATAVTSEAADAAYRRLSLWHATVPGPLAPRPPLPGRVDADVAIVGAGYTGLWTAYYLAVAEPSLRIVVLEREIAGFGASGRNGGWCSAFFPATATAVARRTGDVEGARALSRALRDTVDEVGQISASEGIDCHYAKGGTVVLARGDAQLARARAELAQAAREGSSETDLRLLDAAETSLLLRAEGTFASTYTPHCAAIHPARLVRGLAAAAERRGVRIHERTAGRWLRPGVVETEAGRVRASYVVRATEGYTKSLAGHRRTVAPVYSLVIATEPLSSHVWDQIGLARRETFSDHRHVIIYGQRTADGRMVFGGRGAPYHFGSRIRPEYDREPAVFAGLRRALVELFPVLRDAAVTHTWGGPLGVPRDWFASVGLDRPTGLAWAGGYIGDGVGTANLAGRTLADLILNRDTALTRLPWVGHRSPAWEPEPLRWLAVNVGLRLMACADRAEARSGRASLRARALARLIGD